MSIMLFSDLTKQETDFKSLVAGKIIASLATEPHVTHIAAGFSDLLRTEFVLKHEKLKHQLFINQNYFSEKLTKNIARKIRKALKEAPQIAVVFDVGDPKLLKNILSITENLTSNILILFLRKKGEISEVISSKKFTVGVPSTYSKKLLQNNFKIDAEVIPLPLPLTTAEPKELPLCPPLSIAVAVTDNDEFRNLTRLLEAILLMNFDTKIECLTDNYCATKIADYAALKGLTDKIRVVSEFDYETAQKVINSANAVFALEENYFPFSASLSAALGRPVISPENSAAVEYALKTEGEISNLMTPESIHEALSDFVNEYDSLNSEEIIKNVYSSFSVKAFLNKISELF